MRSVLVAAAAVAALIGVTTIEISDANAVVCARGVRGAACAGPSGAVAVRRPVAACRMVVVNGVRVRRCV